MLQTAEDRLPASTVAWCRFAAQNRVLGGVDVGFEEEDEHVAASEDEMALQLATAGPAVDRRVELGPPLYVSRCIDVSVRCFSLQLMRSLSHLERVSASCPSLARILIVTPTSMLASSLTTCNPCIFGVADGGSPRH